METLSSLKGLVQGELAKSYIHSKKKRFVSYSAAAIIVVLLVFTDYLTTTFSEELVGGTIIFMFSLIIIPEFLRVMQTSKIKAQANTIAGRIVRSQALELFTRYFGEDYIREESEAIEAVLNDIEETEFCEADCVVDTDRLFEFEMLRHILKKNGKATILDSFEFDENYELTINYFTNDSPGEFKPHSFPCAKKEK